MKVTITIEYCPKCGWLLRAAYMAQEILTTFADEVKAVTLQPGETGGQYRIYVNEDRIFDSGEYGHFPEIKTLKQMIRDKINPANNLVPSATTSLLHCRFLHFNYITFLNKFSLIIYPAL